MEITTYFAFKSALEQASDLVAFGGIAYLAYKLGRSNADVTNVDISVLDGKVNSVTSYTRKTKNTNVTTAK